MYGGYIMIHFLIFALLAESVLVAVLFSLWMKEKKATRHYRREADIDGLTLIFNRRATEREIERVFGRIKRGSERGVPVHGDLAIVYLDVRDFREFNERESHQKGDQVLREVAQGLRRFFRRDTDIVGRIGGDEFVVAFEILGSEQEIHKELERKRMLLHEFLDTPVVKVDFGVMRCHLNSDSEETPRALEQVIHMADRRMYAAKRGR